MGWTHADWSALGSVLSGIGTIVGAFAVIWAARLGSGTFESWREQKISERRIDQAERILIATYDAERSLGDLRHAAANLFARGSAQRDLQDGAEALTSEAAKAYRYYETHRETASLARRSLADCLPTAKALFDADLEQAIGELMKQFDIVFADVGWRAELCPTSAKRNGRNSLRASHPKTATRWTPPSPRESRGSKTSAFRSSELQVENVATTGLPSSPRTAACRRSRAGSSSGAGTPAAGAARPRRGSPAVSSAPP